jgi:hypothetical protein
MKSEGVAIDEQWPHPRCSRSVDAVARSLSRGLNPETPAWRFCPAALASSLNEPRANSALRCRPSRWPHLWHCFCPILTPVISRAVWSDSTATPDPRSGMVAQPRSDRLQVRPSQDRALRRHHERRESPWSAFNLPRRVLETHAMAPCSLVSQRH